MINYNKIEFVAYDESCFLPTNNDPNDPPKVFLNPTFIYLFIFSSIGFYKARSQCQDFDQKKEKRKSSNQSTSPNLSWIWIFQNSLVMGWKMGKLTWKYKEKITLIF